MVTKVSIQQEDITIINIHAPDKPLKYMYEAKTDGTEERNKQFYNKSWRFQYPQTKVDRIIRG